MFSSFVLLLLFSISLSEVLQNPETLPGASLYFPGYDLLDVKSLEEEDVLYLRRRGDEPTECGSDCATFSGWQFPPGEVEDIQQDPDADEIVERHIVNRNGTLLTLERRGSPKRAKRPVYDFQDPLSPNEKTWFDFKNIGQMVKAKDENGNKRGYAVEHILEWHLLTDFLKEDAEKNGPASRCALFYSYFTKPVHIETNWNVNEPGKPPESRRVIRDEKRAIDWVVHQFPGIQRDSPFTYEFVIMQADVNGKKKDLWTASAPSLSPALNWDKNGVSQKNSANNFTMEWNMLNKYAKDKEVFYYEKNEGYLLGIKRFRDIVGLYKYHHDAHVNDILVAQLNRIGDAFEYLEKDVLPKMKFDGLPDYKYQDLRKQWLNFMSEHFKQAITKIEAWMAKFEPAMKELADGKRPKSYNGIEAREKRSPFKLELCARSSTDEVTERAKMALEAYEERGKWTNPLEDTETVDAKN
ncbi:hypothetical protein BDV95DRAFT_665424 [Massariosphaeria phaeospora]|uniref:Uncharacterized protein n=1 Tax=Massariosphaeria phaeospora TaxID=100035 RepID=A0A7C8IE06_9PLEO|nr:hypothetical protein BDV95DRAFT_665424 [Massariosphaeria phaeospora]